MLETSGEDIFELILQVVMGIAKKLNAAHQKFVFSGLVKQVKESDKNVRLFLV